jgi:RNA polymerase sigma-70 factor (ECF subfamily)
MIPEMRIHKRNKTLSIEQQIEQNHLYEYVFAYVNRYLRDPVEAEELTQDTIVRAYTHVEQFDPERGRFRSWIKGIAMHRICDKKRGKSYLGMDMVPEKPHRDPSPEQQVCWKQQKQAFLRAMESLRERERQALFSMYIEGKSHQQIADEMGISATNASTLISRARKMCFRLYREYCESMDNGECQEAWSRQTEGFSEMFSMIGSRMWTLELKQMI